MALASRRSECISDSVIVQPVPSKSIVLKSTRNPVHDHLKAPGSVRADLRKSSLVVPALRETLLRSAPGPTHLAGRGSAPGVSSAEKTSTPSPLGSHSGNVCGAEPRPEPTHPAIYRLLLAAQVPISKRIVAECANMRRSFPSRAFRRNSS